MNTNCFCGGKLRRTDIRPVIVGGKTLYADTDPLKTNWKCDRCHRVCTQRKRQKKGDDAKLEAHIERERAKHGLTPREVGFIERAWHASKGRYDVKLKPNT